MKRYITAILSLFVLSTAGVYAQVGEAPDPSALSVDTAQQSLREVSVELFEVDGYWKSSISPDVGFSYSKLFAGGPLPLSEDNPSGKAPLYQRNEDGEEVEVELPNEYVLGTRVDFLHRGAASILFKPLHPIPIEGITKTISLWVVGRNYNHELKVLIEDFFGRSYELYVGRLNFQGWKKLTVAIPPQAEDGKNGIVQRNYHYNNQLGIKLTGLRIDIDPLEAYGSYYVYFDDIRAVTDLFAEENQDSDDMPDNW
ncbi:flagellar filament outer layer protein FlaA [Breznakiellaceae bacterium SP9]